MLTAIVLLLFAVFAYRRGGVGYAEAPSGLAVLHRGEAAFVLAVAEVMFPGRGGLGVSGAEARLPHAVDRYLGALPDAQRWQIRALFLLVEHLTLFMPGNEPGGRRRFGRGISMSGPLDSSPSPVAEPVPSSDPGEDALSQARGRVRVFADYTGPLGLSPFEIAPAVSEAEILFPRIGGARHGIPWTGADRTDPVAAGPLSAAAPRRAANAGRRSAEGAAASADSGEESR